MEKEERKAKYKELAEYLSKARQIMQELYKVGMADGAGFPISARVQYEESRIYGEDSPEAAACIHVSGSESLPFDDVKLVISEGSAFPYVRYKFIDDVAFYSIDEK